MKIKPVSTNENADPMSQIAKDIHFIATVLKVYLILTAIGALIGLIVVIVNEM